MNSIRQTYVYERASMISSNPVWIKDHMKGSKFCYHNQCKGSCPFAHSLSEYRPAQCLYQEFCNNRNCPNCHPNETVDSYMRRMRVIIPDYILRPKQVESKPTEVIVIDGVTYDKRVDEEKHVGMSEREKVSFEAKKISENPSLLRKHFAKSKFCNKPNCHGKCTYAHDQSDYAPPKCLNGKFCFLEYCDLYHPNETVESYMLRVGVSFPSSFDIEDTNIRTVMCTFMTEDEPCSKLNCSFAHSIDELKPKQCKRKECGGDCNYYHVGMSKEVYLDHSGISKKTKPFMFREAFLNKISPELISKKQHQTQMDEIERIRDIAHEEELNNNMANLSIKEFKTIGKSLRRVLYQLLGEVGGEQEKMEKLNVLNPTELLRFEDEEDEEEEEEEEDIQIIINPMPKEIKICHYLNP